MLNVEKFPFELDNSNSSIGSVGLIVLAVDHVIESEFRDIFTLPGIALHHSRIKMATKTTKETLAAMEGELDKTLSLILPECPLDVVAFGCTSASMVIGPSRVTEICQTVKPGVKVTNPFTAAIEALKTLNASPIALVTPYRPEINMQLKTCFEKEGIQVNAMISFNEDNDNNVGRISPDSIEKAALEVGKRPDVNGVFLSCTNLRFAKRVESLEKKLGKPVTSSNHALAWHVLCLLGVGIPDSGWGALYQKTAEKATVRN